MSEEVDTTERDQSLMTMGRIDAILLFLLYFSIICYATYAISLILIDPPSDGKLTNDIIVKSLIISALSGAAIFYARKLYKAGINGSYNFLPIKITMSRISTMSYFLIRLPASAMFSIVVYALWRISLNLSVNSDFEAQQSSVYIYIVMGFFSGFSSGKFINYFEREGMNLAKSGSNGER